MAREKANRKGRASRNPLDLRAEGSKVRYVSISHKLAPYSSTDLGPIAMMWGHERHGRPSVYRQIRCSELKGRRET
jgi:hypothetical protein